MHIYELCLKACFQYLCEKIIYSTTEQCSEGREKCYIGITFLPFPFGNCLSGNADKTSELILT